MRLLILIPLALLLAACSGTGGDPTTTTAAPTTTSTTTSAPTTTTTESSGGPSGFEAGVTTASGLTYVILEDGAGPSPVVGDVVSVHYTGSLEDGTIFDSSFERGQPITFQLGIGQVIPGWDEGIALLTEGSRALLRIPADLAYGSAGRGAIPPDATLVFEVELVAIVPGPPEAPQDVAAEQFVTTDSGLQYHDLDVGDGAVAATGDTVSVHYTGWLDDRSSRFDSSLSRGTPFSFTLGTGQVIPGWDEGVAGMAVGGVRQLVIPADLAYGEAGAGGVIPPGATLIFEVELLEVR